MALKLKLEGEIKDFHSSRRHCLPPLRGTCSFRRRVGMTRGNVVHRAEPHCHWDRIGQIDKTEYFWPLFYADFFVFSKTRNALKL